MKLTLFFSKNISLQYWQESGMFDREVAIYKKHAAKGITPHFITYDRRTSKSITSKILLAHIHNTRWRLPKYIYYTLLPVLHRKHLKKTSIIKTNQISGSLPALQASKLYRKPLIARCGYILSEFMEQKYGKNARRTKRALALEQKLFSQADAIIVTTETMKQSITARIPSAKHKITIIPNYVDTELFKPEPTEKEFDLIFIGRFSEQKNLEALLTAIDKVNCTALIIGNGSNKKTLQQQHPSPNIHWKNNVSNSDLPRWLNSSKIFILPSHYEGHPKVLVEAMACGCAIIGTDVPGIREVITGNINGILSKEDPESLSYAIIKLLGNQNLRQKLSQNARAFALQHYSVDSLADIEYNIIKKAVKKPHVS